MLAKTGPDEMRAAVRRLMRAVASVNIDVTVKRRDVEILLLSRVELEPPAPVQAPSLHPAQR